MWDNNSDIGGVREFKTVVSNQKNRKRYHGLYHDQPNQIIKTSKT